MQGNKLNAHVKAVSNAFLRLTAPVTLPVIARMNRQPIHTRVVVQETAAVAKGCSRPLMTQFQRGRAHL